MKRTANTSHSNQITNQVQASQSLVELNKARPTKGAAKGVAKGQRGQFFRSIGKALRQTNQLGLIKLTTQIARSATEPIIAMAMLCHHKSGKISGLNFAIAMVSVVLFRASIALCDIRIEVEEIPEDVRQVRVTVYKEKEQYAFETMDYMGGSCYKIVNVTSPSSAVYIDCDKIDDNEEYAILLCAHDGTSRCAFPDWKVGFKSFENDHFVYKKDEPNTLVFRFKSRY